MGQNKDMMRPVIPAFAGGSMADRYHGGTERYRPRTPAEVVDDSYTAVIQTTALNTITHMAYDSVRSVVEHKDKLLSVHPELETELNALAFAHVQGLIDIQRQVTDNVRRENG